MEELARLSVSTLTYLHSLNLLNSSVRLIDDSKIKIKANSLHLHLTAIKEKLPLLQETIKKIPEGQNTKHIKALDTYRDQDLTALFNGIRPYKDSRNDKEKEAYQDLKLIFNQYKHVNREAYSLQSLLLTKLLTDLGRDKVKEQIERLGLQKFVTNLKDSHEQFELAYNARQQESGNTKNSDKAKELQKELLTRYKHLCNTASSLAYLHEKGEMETPEAPIILKHLNTARKEVAEQVKRSKTKAKKAKETAKH